MHEIVSKNIEGSILHYHYPNNMFDILRKRMVEAMGMKVYSFEDLDRLDIDSVDSICISDISSDNGDNKSLSSISTDSLSASDMQIEHKAKCKVSKMLRSIKKLERLHELRNDPKLGMLAFIDLLRDQQYKHVNMGLLNKFIKVCKMIPKAYYLHYYIYFLYYASYYHHCRSTVDVIDEKMKQHHQIQLLSIKYQLKYLQHIIKQSRVQEVTL